LYAPPSKEICFNPSSSVVLETIDCLTDTADSSILGVVTGVEPNSSKPLTLQQAVLHSRAAQLIQENRLCTAAKLRS